jgi:hypothetical protein
MDSRTASRVEEGETDARLGASRLRERRRSLAAVDRHSTRRRPGLATVTALPPVCFEPAGRPGRLSNFAAGLCSGMC